MRYPPQFLDRIRQHFRLSEVIGRRVPLRRAGREYQACCPFHQEKTPSFTINDEKGFYHCFGCGAHGDVVGFVKDFEGMTYVQAVEALAREAGLELPRETPEIRQKLQRSEELYVVLERAAQWFAQQLQRTTGASARDYLVRRGVKTDMIGAFRLGYAPEAREGLKSALLAQQIPLRDISDVGLLSQPEQGAPYDKFRGRIIFPIRDLGGRVVGFGGRLMAPVDHAPKYLNSPQTLLFDKGRLLYNADQARALAVRSGRLLVAEGYMDVIALHQAGFTESVAPLGTAVTEEHLRLLWQWVDEPVFCLDGDSAGIKAMQRVANLAVPLLKPGKSLRFCLLPAGEDPDSLIKARGVEAMEEALRTALPLAEMLWRIHVGEKNQATPELRAAAEQELLRAVERIQDPAVRRAYASEMRGRLWNLSRSSGKSSARLMRKPQEGGAYDPAVLKASVSGASDVDGQRDVCIRQLLSILTSFPKLLEHMEVDGMVAALSPAHPETAVWHQTLVEVAMGGVLCREVFAELSVKEEAAWQGTAKPYDVRRLIRMEEEEGAPLALRYVRRLMAQLLEIELGEELRAVARDTGHDETARERLVALQQQLRHMQAEAEDALDGGAM